MLRGEPRRSSCLPRSGVSFVAKEPVYLPLVAGQGSLCKMPPAEAVLELKTLEGLRKLARG